MDDLILRCKDNHLNTHYWRYDIIICLYVMMTWQARILKSQWNVSIWIIDILEWSVSHYFTRGWFEKSLQVTTILQRQTLPLFCYEYNTVSWCTKASMNTSAKWKHRNMIWSIYLINALNLVSNFSPIYHHCKLFCIWSLNFMFYVYSIVYFKKLLAKRWEYIIKHTSRNKE